MDVFELVRKAEKKLKLFVLYWRRIIFVRNKFNVSPAVKIKANVFGGFLADQWALYDLDMKKRKEYLSEFDWYRSRYINEPFDEMLNNKIISTEVLRQYVKVPVVYMINSDGTTYDYSGRIVNKRDILTMIKGKKDCIVKPFRKGKGTDVHRITYDDCTYSIDDVPSCGHDILTLLSKNKDWYISETIKQHPYADALYGKTVNTIRIITIKDPKTGKMKVFFAVQRIGTSKTVPVDNASQGGLVCKIDIETGRLSYGRSLRDNVIYKKHPDSGILFEDVIVPGWKNLKKQVLNLCNHFPYLHFVAWDVAILPDGTGCMIEANTSSGVNIIQLWGGQRNDELGDFYRYHRVIKR